MAVKDVPFLDLGRFVALVVALEDAVGLVVLVVQVPWVTEPRFLRPGLRYHERMRSAFSTASLGLYGRRVCCACVPCLTD